jgi:hypothetical protein
MFKLIRRLIIIVLAAIAGTIFYNRYTAVDRVIQPAFMKSPEEQARMAAQNEGGIGKIGGIGKVGNNGKAQPQRQNPPSRTTSGAQRLHAD